MSCASQLTDLSTSTYDDTVFNLLVYVNQPHLPPMPPNIFVVGYKGEVEIDGTDIDLDGVIKGEVLVARGMKNDIEHWLNGETVILAKDGTGQSWAKYTMPVRLKH